MAIAHFAALEIEQLCVLPSQRFQIDNLSYSSEPETVFPIKRNN
jgi:hypothetical protein